MSSKKGAAKSDSSDKNAQALRDIQARCAENKLCFECRQVKISSLAHVAYKVSDISPIRLSLFLDRSQYLRWYNLVRFIRDMYYKRVTIVKAQFMLYKSLITITIVITTLVMFKHPKLL
jgi:hypothetical protein